MFPPNSKLQLLFVSLNLFFRYDAELLVAQGYAMCNERKACSEENGTSSGGSSHDGKIPATNGGAKRRRRLQSRKESYDTNISSAPHQNGSTLNVSDKESVNGTVRSLRSRTVRSGGNPIIPAATTNSQTPLPQLVETDGTRSGMRLRSKKTLESAPQSTSPSASCPAAPTETEADVEAETEAGMEAETETETENTCVASGDVYEFTDSENENGHEEESPQNSERDIAMEETKARPVTPPPPTSQEVASRQPMLMASPGGRLKLTLRMKRSPVLDEVIESGSSMNGHSNLQQQNLIPVYEVLRVEGLEMEPENEQVHKRRVRRTQRRRSPPETNSSRMGVLPTTKRLRLIFGNESHTIDLPPTNLSNFPAVE